MYCKSWLRLIRRSVFWELMNQNKIDYIIVNPRWSPRVFQDAKLKKEMPRYMELVSNAQNVVPIFKRVSFPVPP